GPAGSGLLVAAGPDFDHGVTAADSPAAPLPAGKRRGAACGTMDHLRFDPLPGTLEEESNVVLLWKKYHERSAPESPSNGAAGRQQAAVFALPGADASERAFKQEAPGRSVLHLATHGFFLTGACPPDEPGADPFAPEAEPNAAPALEDDPLL